MKKKIVLLLMMTECGLLGCSSKPNIKNGHLQTVQAESMGNTLYYTGIIQPLNTQVITSPADGVVVDMPFQYGESIKQGQLLFSLESEKFLTDYKTALMQYVKAKSDFDTAKIQNNEANFLIKNELISKDEFKTKQAAFYASQLALVQAKDALSVFLQRLNLKNINLDDLTMSNVSQVTQAMHLQSESQRLLMSAPTAGVVLTATKNGSDAKFLTKGDAVRQGDVLALIGDVSGLRVTVKVNELVVNKLQVGQKVMVTGIAFPGAQLQGEIQEVDRQGDVATGGQPTFNVAIVVPKLTPEQQQEIHVGMSAKLEIHMNDKPEIRIPIEAVTEKDNTPFVKLYDTQQKKLRMVAVKTGDTSIDSVIVLAGLKSGDQIVVPN